MLSNNDDIQQLERLDSENNHLSIFGIQFWKKTCGNLVKSLKHKGGLLVVPSGPNLTDCRKDKVYRKALKTADFAVMDSGFLALILKFRGIRGTQRISGFEVLENFLNFPNEKSKKACASALGERETGPASVRSCELCLDEKHNETEHKGDLNLGVGIIGHDKVLWVVPDQEEQGRIEYLIQSHPEGFMRENHSFYLAPFYSDKPGSSKPIEDDTLLKIIQDIAPQWVVLCVAGGKQEKLGLFLRDSLRKCKMQKENGKLPAILCTGAAIAFFTGGQANIPRWADRMYLGWLCRIIQSPRKYFHRYFQALRLPFVLHEWEDSARDSGRCSDDPGV